MSRMGYNVGICMHYYVHVLHECGVTCGGAVILSSLVLERWLVGEDSIVSLLSATVSTGTSI